MEIGINGQFFKAKKKFFQGTHRLCSPEETLEKVLRETKRIGVTRIADITGFDHIGIPVTSIVRPNALTLSTASGKGLTKTSASVSGIMEALEVYHAEMHQFEPFIATPEELADQAIPLDQLCRRKHAVFPKNWPYQWCFAWDLVTQKEIAIPIMAVSLDFRNIHSYRYDLNVFETTSNGLASGNHPLEAITSGIYEVIERDGIMCCGDNAPKIRLETITLPVVRELIETLKHAGVGLSLYDCRTDTDVYVIKCITYDRSIGIFGGYGAHLDPEVAMIRAITESIQARAILVSGSRDDIFHSDFQIVRKFNTPGQIESFDRAEGTVDASGFKSMACKTFEEDIHLLIGKLKNAGIEHVLVFDLSTVDSCFSVFKVIIPKLEGYHTATYQPKKRSLHSIYEKGFHKPAGAM